MKKIFGSVFIIATIFFPSCALAYSDYYKCKVTGIADTWGETETAKYWLNRYMDEEIFVDRETGEVKHLGLGNTAYDKLELLHSGDNGNAFKVISRSNNGWQAHYMIVEEYAEDDEKRFLIVTGGTVWRGNCK